MDRAPPVLVIARAELEDLHRDKWTFACMAFLAGVAAGLVLATIVQLLDRLP